MPAPKATYRPRRSGAGSVSRRSESAHTMPDYHFAALAELAAAVDAEITDMKHSA